MVKVSLLISKFKLILVVEMKWIIVLATMLLAAGSVMAHQHDGDGGKFNGAEPSNHTHADAGPNKTTEDNATSAGNKSDMEQKIEKNNGTGKEKVKEKLEERLKNKLQSNEGNGNGNGIGKNGTDQKQKVREQIKEKIEQSRSATDNAKQNYHEAKQNYLKAKQGDKASQARFHARTMMQKGINYMDTWLERIELRTLNSDLDNETKLEILNKIDEYRNGTREKLEKINNTTNISQMREVARDLNHQWKDIRLFIKATGYQIAAGELENIVERAGNLEPKLERMRGNANNTTRFDIFVSDYRHNLEMAEVNVEQAQNILGNATNVQEVMEGHNLVIKATNNLKQVFKDIKLIKNEFLA